MSNVRLAVGVIVIVLSVTEIPIVTLEFPLLRVILLDVAVVASTTVLIMTTIGVFTETFVAEVPLLRSTVPDLMLIIESAGAGSSFLHDTIVRKMLKMKMLEPLNVLFIICFYLVVCLP